MIKKKRGGFQKEMYFLFVMNMCLDFSLKCQDKKLHVSIYEVYIAISHPENAVVVRHE